jgi:hypothetical protein
VPQATAPPSPRGFMPLTDIQIQTLDLLGVPVKAFVG